LDNADIIILTPEMFNSKCRFYESNTWLHNSVFIGDEIHLLGLEGRGDAEEVGIVQYYENSPNSRALFLSATLPNVDDFGKWLEAMSGRPSKVIVSHYRPCKLNKQFYPFTGGKSWDETETRRMNATIDLIKKHQTEPMIVFVGSKKFGNTLCYRLKEASIPHYFHNADLDREKRRKIENGFKTGEFKVLISTSTLAWGVNTSARYVIIAHTSIGQNPIHPSNILQEMGRAGRTGWSDKGDVYIVCEDRKIAGPSGENERIFSKYKVKSTLSDINTLCFMSFRMLLMVLSRLRKIYLIGTRKHYRLFRDKKLILL
jgi:replicative superfamily II helicase